MNPSQQPEPLLDAMAEEEAAAARASAEAAAVLQEEGDVNEWLRRIEAARKLDKDAREGYALDRRYCSNDANGDVYDVRVPIAGIYVNLLTGYLYARDPEPSVEPGNALTSPEDKQTAKAFAESLDVYLSRTWRKSKLKQAMDGLVRSGNSIGLGWLKSAWHRQTGPNPQTAQEIRTLQEQLTALDAQAKQLTDETAVANLEAQRADYQRKLQKLQAEASRPLFNGSVKDFVRAEDIQVAPECPSLREYWNSPWIAHRTFKRLDTAKVDHPEISELLASATSYSRRDPGEDCADGVQYSKDATNTEGDDTTRYVCLWEVWDKESGHVLTVAEGCKRYVIKPYQPQQRTTRFYPFFLWAPLWIDGERHPRSLVSLSRPLLDEYNRIRTNYREHRRRAIPKMGFDKGNMEPAEVERIERAVTQEYVGLDLQGKPSKDVLFPISYNAIDPSLYDTQVIRQELEMIWGIQEAMSSTIRVAKTATEADIQQQGTETRLGYSRDQLDEMLGDLARYDAEQATSEHGLTDSEAREVIGRDCIWMQVPDPETLEALVSIDIRAGSSGKPATALRQQQWSVLLPQLQQAAVQIGQLRGTPPGAIADCLEQLAVETVKRAGDTSIDPYQFIPQPMVDPMADALPGGMPVPGAAPALPPPDPAAAAALAEEPAAAPPV